jgi:hypothetical protein
VAENGRVLLVEPKLSYRLEAVASKGPIRLFGIEAQHVYLRQASASVAAYLNRVHLASGRPVADVVGGAAAVIYTASIMLHGRRDGKLNFRHIQRYGY